MEGGTPSVSAKVGDAAVAERRQRGGVAQPALEQHLAHPRAMAQLVEQRVRPVEGEPDPRGGGADAADAREAVKVEPPKAPTARQVTSSMVRGR